MAEKSLSREEAFEQERKKIMKRSFEPQRRGGKVNLHSIGSVDDDDAIMVSAVPAPLQEETTETGSASAAAGENH